METGWPRGGRWVWVAAAAVAAMGTWGAVPESASAGNEDPILQGPDAALTSGAVTATTRDGAAAYYNPAGIAHIDRGQINLSAQVIQLQRLAIESVVSIADGPSEDADVLVLPMLPAGVIYGGKLSDDLSWGGGIFVAQQFAYTLRASLDGGPPLEPLNVTIALEQREINTLGGLGLGWTPLPGLRLGLSFLGRYREQYGAVVFSGGQVTPDPMNPEPDGLFFTASESYGAQGAGAELRAGVQWDITPAWTLGAAVWTPTFNVYTAQQETGAETARIPGVTPDEGVALYDPIDVDESAWGFDQVSSWRFRGGIAFQGDWGWASIEGDVQPAYESPSLGIDRELVYNLRAGGRVRLGEVLALGFGLFTDRHAIPDDGGQLLQPRIHLYGGTIGVAYDDRHRLGDEEAARDIRFQTGFSLRLAYGQGKYSSLAFTQSGIESRLVDASLLEAGLYLTSGLYF